MLDKKKLLVDIDDRHPCGKGDFFEEMEKIRQASLPKKGDEFMKDGKLISVPDKPADWATVNALCLKLCKKKHDLHVLCSLTESMTHLYGFKGLHEACSHLVDIMENYWDCVYPQMEEGSQGYEKRLAHFSLFSDADLSKALTDSPILETRGLGATNLEEMEQALQNWNTKNAKKVSAIIQKSRDDAKEDDQPWAVDVAQEAIKYSKSAVESLRDKLAELCGADHPYFPDFESLLDTHDKGLETIHDLVTLIDEEGEAGTGEDAVMSQNKNSDMPKSTSVPLSANGINSREDAIKAIEQIEKYFKQNEPSSPVPYILKRARGMINQDFMALTKDLAPGGVREVQTIFGTSDE